MGNTIVVVVVVDIVAVLARMFVVGMFVVGIHFVRSSETGIVVAGNAIVVGMSEVEIGCNFLYAVEQLGSYFRLCSIGIWIAGCWS